MLFGGVELGYHFKGDTDLSQCTFYFRGSVVLK